MYNGITLQVVLMGALAGLICGLIPLLYGIKKDKNMAIGSIAITITIGAIAGLIGALPSALVFTFAIRHSYNKKMSKRVL